jgi:hypothetical protein
LDYLQRNKRERGVVLRYLQRTRRAATQQMQRAKSVLFTSFVKQELKVKTSDN